MILLGWPGWLIVTSQISPITFGHVANKEGFEVVKKVVTHLSSAFLALMTAAPVTAQAQRPNLPPIPTYEVHRARIAPQINGRLDDAAWQAAKPVTFVFPWADQTGKKQKTVARLTWDNDNLYIAYACDD